MQSQTQYQQSITGQQQQIFTMNQVSNKQPPAIVPSTPIQSNLQQPPIIGITPISQINSIIPDQQRNLVESGGLIQPQLSKPYSTNLFASSSQQQLIPNQAKIHSTNFEMASMLQNCILNNDLNNAISNSHLSQDHRKSSNPL